MRTAGRLWWKQTLYDAENEYIKISNLSAQQIATLTIY
jgi:hypothetical protein